MRNIAPIAQLVEQLPLKQWVVGSNPTGRTTLWKSPILGISKVWWLYTTKLELFSPRTQTLDLSRLADSALTPSPVRTSFSFLIGGGMREMLVERTRVRKFFEVKKRAIRIMLNGDITTWLFNGINTEYEPLTHMKTKL